MKTSRIFFALAFAALLISGCPIANTHVTGVILNKPTTGMLVGGMEQLWAIVSPANATNQRLTWSASDAGVAAVSETGLVTAVAQWERLRSR